MTAKIALIEPSVPADMLAYRVGAQTSEPIHLVGMYNLLRSAGAEAEIIDAFSLGIPEQELAERLLREGFSHAAFSTYESPATIAYLQHVIAALDGRLDVILGGWGASYSPGRMRRFLNPSLIIQGDGEIILPELLRCGFDPQALSAQYVVHKVNGSAIIEAPSIGLDDIPYYSPYSLELYGYEASPRFQRGCRGKCIFCSGAYVDEIDYISPRVAVEQLHYLADEKKAIRINPVLPDFTASPRRANAILREILKASLSFQSFQFEVRIDTLAASVESAPEVWKEFSRQTRLRFETAIDSFSYPRLQRLGKNTSKKFLDHQLEHLERILEACDCQIVLGRIALDPFVSLDEFILDCDEFTRVLEAFPEHVTLGLAVMNEFRPIWGTPCMEAGDQDNPWSAKGVYADPAIAKLKSELLDKPDFRKWCWLALHIGEYRSRNAVLCEILQTAREKAASLKRCLQPAGS